MADYQPATLNRYQEVMNILQKTVLLDMMDKGLYKGVVPSYRFEDLKATFGEPITLQIDTDELNNVHYTIVPSRPDAVPGVVYELELEDAETY